MGFEKKSRPAARGWLNGTQSIPTATQTAISLNTQNYDTDAMFTPTDTKIYAKRFGGYYLGFANANFSPNSTGYRAVYIRRNGSPTDIVAMVSAGNWGADDGPTLHVGDVFYLNVNEYVELCVTQTSGANLNVNGGTYLTFLTLAHHSGR